ncbi:MAG: Gfo/Idh/MocA family oxidoreductase [Oscillospiraceae bacterium]|jgi:predicted dehydrogenase|nr:Gfo/Idh/MocA family oxidoreductase [Oscillospiraceae bacterium]
MIAYAVVGTSTITKEFVAAAEGSGLRLAAICSRETARGAAFAKEIGLAALPVLEGVDALAAANEITAAYVASPNSCHYAQCMQLLCAGKHVLCEKPLTVSAAELAALQACAAERGLILMEAIMYLQTPARRAVLETLPRIGRVTSVRIDFSQRSSRLDRLLAGELPNIFNARLRAGAFNDLGVYCVYPLLDFFGDPEELLYARFACIYPGAADTDGSALFRYPDFDAQLSWSKVGQSRGVSQIIGENGTLTVQSISQFQGVFLYDRAGNPQRLDKACAKIDTMRHEARAFYAAISGQSTRVAPGEAAALALRVCRCMEETRDFNRK